MNRDRSRHATSNDWRAIYDRAVDEARRSGLPGRTSGPADAFRHIVGSGEAARLKGLLPAWVAGEYNEIAGTYGRDRQRPEDREMDRRNNEVGLLIGRDAKSFEEIVEKAKAAISEAAERDGIPGPVPARNAAVWRPRDEWREDETKRDRSNWPPVWNEGNDKDADRILARPVAEWTQDDVRTVQDARIYWRGDGPARDMAFEKVRQWYETRSGVAPEAGGPVSVRAYVRADGSRVAGHSRAVPLRDGVRR